MPTGLSPYLLPRAIFKPVWGSLYMAELSPAATEGECGGTLAWGAQLRWWHGGFPGTRQVC